VTAVTTTTTATTTKATTTAPVLATEKVSLGRLNAAHAVANGNTRAASHSAVGQLATYAAALTGYEKATSEDKSKKMEAAAAALDGVANKELNTATIQALNEILGISETVVKAADVMAAVDALRNPLTDADETPTETAEGPRTDATSSVPVSE